MIERMMDDDAEPMCRNAVSVQVLAPDGARIEAPPRTRLTFGRGREADIVIPGGRSLARRAGEIEVDGRGAVVMNLSRQHPLFVAGDGYRLRLPRAGDEGPVGGWLVARGTAAVGSIAMMRQGTAVRIIAMEQPRTSCPLADGVGGQPAITVQPFAIRPDTKLFLVALLLCRPWLFDPDHLTPLPTAPEVARQALDFVGASDQLERFDLDADFRKRLVEQVNDDLRYLGERLLAAGLIPEENRLTLPASAELLLGSEIVTLSDLVMTERPQWRSRQEDLWAAVK
jgi:hypothetical protein